MLQTEPSKLISWHRAALVRQLREGVAYGTNPAWAEGPDHSSSAMVSTVVMCQVSPLPVMYARRLSGQRCSNGTPRAEEGTWGAGLETMMADGGTVVPTCSATLRVRGFWAGPDIWDPLLDKFSRLGSTARRLRECRFCSAGRWRIEGELTVRRR